MKKIQKQLVIVTLYINVLTYSQLLTPVAISKKEAYYNTKQYEQLNLQLEETKINDEIKNKQQSGYLKIDEVTDSALYYIFYNARKRVEEDQTRIPIILWLSGGPGQSSQRGNFVEFGPNYLELNDILNKYVEKPRDISWNDDYHLLFIDQPVGTGLSYLAEGASYPSTLVTVTQHIYTALVNFYSKIEFQQYRDTDIYIFGEGFAGHFIPPLARYIIEQNSEFKIQLKGIGIGNGWVDPINQLSENGLFAYALGLADDLQKQQIERDQLEAALKIKKNDFSGALTNFEKIVELMKFGGGGVNDYNYRKFLKEDDDLDMEAYFQDSETRKLYNVDSRLQTFYAVNTKVYNALKNEIMQSVANDFTIILDNIRVLLYQGQDDLIVNTPSSQKWIQTLKWNKIHEFNNLNLQTWKINDYVAGLTKNIDNLTYVLFYKAGHIVPKDQKIPCYHMIKKFIEKQQL